jgi:hypothetical protein
MLLIPPAKISKIFWTGESEGADTNTGHLGLFLLPAGTTALLLTGEFSEAPGPPLPANLPLPWRARMGIGIARPSHAAPLLPRHVGLPMRVECALHCTVPRSKHCGEQSEPS